MGKSIFLCGPMGLVLGLSACNPSGAYGVELLSLLQGTNASAWSAAPRAVNQATDLAQAASLNPQRGLSAPPAPPPSGEMLAEVELPPPRFSQAPVLSPASAAPQSANRITQLAQQPTPPPPIPPTPPPSLEPLPETEPALPPPSDLLEPPAEAPLPPALPDDPSGRICVGQFIVTGSTIFSSEALSQAARKAVFLSDTPRCNLPTNEIGYELTFPQLLQARSAVTQFYLERQYATSGAYLPPQTLEAGIVEIKIVEGWLEGILVTGNQRLNTDYLTSRLAIAGSPPLNVERLLEGLQLLQVNPLIETIDAELSTGIAPGASLLEVEIVEADAFELQLTLDNERAPRVGSVRQQIEISHINLSGQGDNFRISFANTSGSEALNFGYTWPMNPRNGTLSFNVGVGWSRVIEDSFDILNISSKSRFYELTVRQPIFQTPREEFGLSFSASRQESEAVYNPFNIGEAPLESRGSDADGHTQVTAIRFAQDWVRRSERQVVAARSQFSLGLDLFDATVNETPPDGRFFAWRGQAQWIRLLGPDTLFLLRGEAQLADRPLPSLEQISLGGQRTARGYPQDVLRSDNGAAISAELRLPLYRNANIDELLHIKPFVDIGVGWNQGRERFDPNTLVGIGLGMEWRQGDNFFVRLDWGVPLVATEPQGESLQENGLYFSVNFSPF